MPLSADRQAMLQLLLERGQTYADLASVLAVDESEVRSRARSALTELAGVDPDREVGLTDYLLGQADPIGRADAVRHLKEHPADLDLATELAQKLRLVAPEAELPRLPGEERRPRPPRRGRASASWMPLPERMRRRTAGAGSGGEPGATAAPRTALTRRQTQLMVGLASGAVLLIVIILAVTGSFEGNDDEGDGSTAAATTTPSIENLTSVQLEPQAGGDASGVARFALADGQTPLVDIRLNGLKPVPNAQTYVIWLLLAPNQGYPLSPIQSCGAGVSEACLSKDGAFSNRFPIPSSILPLVTRVRFVDVSLAPAETVRQTIQTAIRERNIVIQRAGTTVLRGAIPSSRRSAGRR